MAPHGKTLSKDLRFRIVALHKDGIDYRPFHNTGPEALPVSVCNCFLYFTCKENILKNFLIQF